MLDLAISAIKRARGWLLAVTRPGSMTATGAAILDLSRSKPTLVAENAFLRHQLVVLARTAGRPRLSTWDRSVMVLLARANPAWRDALVVVKPETLLSWHRSLFRLVWRRKSRPRGRQPRITPETVELIKQMARDNPWGAERIRGYPSARLRRILRSGCSSSPPGTFAAGRKPRLFVLAVTTP